MLRILAGFGHAFLAPSGVVVFTSGVAHFDSAPSERTHAWNDFDLSIPWSARNSKAIAVVKESRGLRIADAEVFV